MITALSLVYDGQRKSENYIRQYLTLLLSCSIDTKYEKKEIRKKNRNAYTKYFWYKIEVVTF